jgi:hypothetical protein
MQQEAVETRIARHHDFWERKPLDRPLVSFQLHDYFISNRMHASAKLRIDKQKIEPAMLDVDSFLDDYERMYHEACATGQDGFWVAEPFCGIPWMEAIFGCDIYATQNSFISSHCIDTPEGLKKIRFDADNPWVRKYLEFVDKLTRLSAGRFPIGQPIMRGASDIVGALLGQTEMVYAIYEEPEIVREAYFKVLDGFKRVIRMQFEATPRFLGGYSMGLYDVWCPEKCIWFQEDLCALLSPQIYTDFLLAPDASVCDGYEYTAMHLHPASFFIVDALLQIDRLKAIQINKDVGGPSVAEMIPVFRKVLEQKNLIVFGDLDEAEIDCLLAELPRTGLFLNIFAPSVERAAQLMDYVAEQSRN